MRLCTRSVANLGATRGANRHHLLLSTRAHCREKGQFAHRHGDIVMLGFVAKRASHSATTRRNDFYRITKISQKVCRRRLPHRKPVRGGRLRFLVAMAVKQNRLAGGG